MSHKPNWDDYFFTIMQAASVRSTCNRGRCACLLVKDNIILATGYAGALPDFPHCDDVGHRIEESRIVVDIKDYEMSTKRINEELIK